MILSPPVVSSRFRTSSERTAPRKTHPVQKIIVFLKTDLTWSNDYEKREIMFCKSLQTIFMDCKLFFAIWPNAVNARRFLRITVWLI